MKRIYLDNGASTPIDRRVKKEILRSMDFYANPSSFNDMGRRARDVIDKSRKKLAKFIGARPDEIVFTSSGTEANNLAILGVVRAYLRPQSLVVTSSIEHSSVLGPMGLLSKSGIKTRYLRVDSKGLTDPGDLVRLINKNTLLVSVMYANNEIGTIEPIAEIAKIVSNFRKEKKSELPFFHTDASQAAGWLEINVNKLGVDLMTLDGAKIYGPRGIGVLYVKRGIKIKPVILGGGQENGRRSSTENIGCIVGLAKAVSVVSKDARGKVCKLRDYFIERLLKLPIDLIINGPVGRDRLPNNINLSVKGISNEDLLLELDKYGIYAGSGSACTSHSIEPSHVLKAIGVANQYLRGSIRITLGRDTKKSDLDYVIKILPKIVRTLKKRYNF